jgi:tetratricopeptide (TPR) repeat protein
MKKVCNLLLGLILYTSLILSQTGNEELTIQASKLMNMNRFGEAIDLLNRFIASNPQNIDGYLLRGTCYEKRGDFEFAVYDYRTAKKISPNSSEVNRKLNFATETWNKLLLNKIEGHKREIAIHPDRASNYLAIGIAYKNLGNWNEAEIWYDEYLKRDEASSDEILRYTEILAKNNQLTKGEVILKKYTSRYSNDHRIWSRYGYYLYWLGKFRLAVIAFEESLRLRPFFKEALNGLDLAKGKGYLYTINDTTSKYYYGLAPGTPEYKIDKLYRRMKNHPDDDNSRFELVDALVKANRFEEAYDQLRILSKKHKDSVDFQNLYSKVLEYRNAHYKSKINEFKNILVNDVDNIEALLQLGKYYSYQNEFSLAKEMYLRYLAIKPADLHVRFLYAQLLTWDNELCDAKNESDFLLVNAPENTEYQLLGANIRLWINEDAEEGLRLYNKVLAKQPENRIALLGKANLNLRLNNVKDAEKIYSLLSKNGTDPDKDLMDLSDNIDFTKKSIKETELFLYLEKARAHSLNNECFDAIMYYEKYFAEGGIDQQVYFELANAHQCYGNYDQAINIYDSLVLSGSDDLETLKQRAKIIFWGGDSLRAFREFKKLVEEYPDDPEVKLFLGDSYVQLKQYRSAREIYSELMKQSSGSYILQKRMKWLGNAGVNTFSLSTFPTYVLVSPQANYFSDNLDFKYNLAGLGLEIGATDYLSLGISGYRGYLASEISKLNFNSLKGSAFIKFNNYVRGIISFGQTYFMNDSNENIIEIALNFEKENIYTASFFYNKMDAAFILYSPFLVTRRLISDYAGFNGKYYFNSGLMIAGKYAFIKVSDGNEGNQVQFRLGKKFQEGLRAGYEYYYYTLSDFSELYWSPEYFEAHSVWADFNLVEDSTVDLIIGGKFGLIPENDYLLREFYSEFKFKIADNFSLQTRLVIGSSSRSGSGYNSTSVQLSAFWTL